VGSRSKLQKFEEVESFDNVIKPKIEVIHSRAHPLKGRWNKDFFYNTNPIVLELGCGRGEYTVAMARQYPHINFIGVDIKGARIWKGAKLAINEQINNAAFIRTYIEFIDAFFAEHEIAEIWLTFPDPQEKKARIKKRLTSSRFLNLYRKILKDDGIIHLKTDNQSLFDYTRQVLAYNHISPVELIEDLHMYSKEAFDLQIKTYYENKFLEEGKKILYMRFKLSQTQEINEPPSK
jgi:tRNA (guanine-N7-)-methyltransferase